MNARLAPLANAASDLSPRRTMRGRVALAIFVVATAFFLTVAALSPSRPWLRIMIAPAWIAGAEVSGDANQPSRVVVLLALLVFAAGLGMLAGHARPDRIRPEPPSPGAVTANLTVLFVVLALEAVFGRPVARSLRNLTGVPGDVGSEFPAFLSLRLVPGLFGFAAAALSATLIVIRIRPHLTRAVQLSLWILNIFFVLTCYSWYFSPHVP